MTNAFLDIPYYGPPLDRRQKRTRAAIESALLELLETKPLPQITVTELTAKADVNRKTFYNNYESINDVIDSIHSRISMHIYKSLPDTITIHNEIEIYHLLLDYSKLLEPHKRLIRHLIRTQDNSSIIEQFKAKILPYIEKNLLNYNIAPALIPYINSYIVMGLTSIYIEWTRDDQLTAEQVALLGYNLTVSAIKLDNYKDIFK